MAKIPCLCGIDVAGDNLCKNSKIVLTSTVGDDILRFVVEAAPRQHNSSKET